MRSGLTPEQVKQRVREGVQAFPLTDFDEAGEFVPAAYRERVEWMQSHEPGALFVAGGAGEFFSLTPREYSDVVSNALVARTGGTPVIAAAGYGTKLAIEYAQEAERLDADGILLLPPYLTETSQDGLLAHIARVCNSTRLAVIVYNRGNCRLSASTLRTLVDRCPNLVGFKDGVGNVEELIRVKSMVGSEIALINGMPTAEIYAPTFRSLGINSYSSAVFCFSPLIAKKFYKALMADDHDATSVMMREFFGEYCRLRASQPGYAVSIAKAGARLTGHGAGPVRPPIHDLNAEEEQVLSRLIARFETLPN